MNKENLLKYKKYVIPRDVDISEIRNHIISRYTCKDIINRFLKTTWYQMFAENYKAKYGEDISPSKVFAYEIEKDEKSKTLSAASYGENIIFVIEGEKCFFETNNEELFYEISFFKSVPLKDYTEETDDLFEFLSRIDQRFGNSTSI